MTRSRVLVALALVAIATSWFAEPHARAQSTAGTIEGRVLDSSGAVLPGALVNVTSRATGAVRPVVTNEQGLFRAPGLNPGAYDVTVELTGFSTVQQTGIELGVSQTVTLSISLSLGSLTESVQVQAETPLINSANASVGSTVDARRVLDLPVNSRDFSRLALFAPSAKVSSSGVANLTFNGTDSAQNNFLLDGTDATHVDNSYMSNGRERGARLQTASSESVAEFRVLSSNYSAEYGRAAGAIVTAITKSGSNQFKGSAYTFLRDDALDARNFFDPAEQPLFQLKQFGGSLGGPVVSDRLFFFTNYEGGRKTLGSTQTGTVPSAAFRATVPSSLQPLLGTIPLPTQETANPNVGIAQVSGLTEIEENIFSARVDVKTGQSDLLYGRFNVQDSFIEGPLFVLTSSAFAGQRQRAPIVSGTGTLSYTTSISQNVLSETKVGINRVHLTLNQTIDGLFPTVDSVKTADAKAFPNVIITGVDVRPGGLQDIDRTNLGFEFIEGLTYLRGTHAFKAGLNVRRKQTEAFQAGYPTITYASLADFQANRILNYTVSDDGGPGTVYGWEYAGYIQDNWKVTPRLTLDLGLRYDYGAPMRGGADTRLANFDLSTLAFDTEGTFYAPDRNNLAPRVSATYDLSGTGKTVVGAGYGTFYNPYPLQLFYTYTMFSNVPRSTTLNQTTTPGLSFPVTALQGGLTPAPNVTALDPNRRDNYNHQFTFNVQHQLARDYSLQLSYVGNRTFNNERTKPGNLVDPALGGQRPYPQYAQFSVVTNTGRGQYDGLQVQLNKRISHGFAFNLSYAWSKFLNDISSPQVPGPFLDFASYPAWDLEWGPANEDVPHNLSFNSIWELPLGDHALLKGWQLNSIVLARSGLPYTVLLGTSRGGQGWFTNQRPNASGLDPAGDPDGPLKWLNRDGFSDTLAGTYGNLGRNTARGPRFVQVDMSLLKNTQIGALGRLQFRVEVFNVLNSPIWAAAPSATYLTPASFGRVLNTFGRTESFGTARQIQLAVRFDF